MRKICFYSLRRSGHHAIMNWFQSNVKGSTKLVNNIASQNWDVKNINISEHIIENMQNCDAFFCNIEEYNFSNKKFENFVEGVQCEPFYVFRNPFNMMASRIKSSMSIETIDNENNSLKTLSYWKSYAKMFIEKKENIFCFDYWFLDKNYRQKMAEIMGVEYSDVSINQVLDYGYGSSFDNRKFDGKAQQMNVMQRYKYFIDNPKFMKLFDDEIYYLANLIFDKSYLPNKKIIKL